MGPRGRLHQQSPDPGGGGVAGGVEVDQLSAAVTDEEHYVEDLVADGLEAEKVGRPDPVEMISEEGAPSLAALGT